MIIEAEELISAVSGGIGISVVPGLTARRAAARGEVWIGSIRGVHFPQSFYMVCHRDKYMPQVADRFVRLCRTFGER